MPPPKGRGIISIIKPPKRGHNNIGCIHFVVVSLQHSLQRRGYKHSNVGQKNQLCCLHCRHVFLFRNVYMWPASTLASMVWPRLTTLCETIVCQVLYYTRLAALHNSLQFM